MPIELSIININDPHMSVKPPHSRRDDYMQCIGTKLAEVAELAGAWSVDAITCTGDIFHRKSQATPHDVTAAIDAFRVLQPWWPIYSIVGNHDSPDPHTVEHKAIRTLEEAGVIQLVSRRPIVRNGVLICGVDYERKASCAIDGCVPSKDLMERAEWVNQDGKLVQPPKASLILTHANLWNSGKFPGGGEHIKMIPLVNHLSEAWLYLPCLVLNGHLHMNQHPDGIPVLHPNGQTACLSAGSITRVARDEADNHPSIVSAIYGDGKWSARVVELVKSVQDDVFVDLAEEVGEDNEAIVSFVQALKDEGGLVEGEELVTLIGEVSDKMGVTNEVRNRALSYAGR